MVISNFMVIKNLLKLLENLWKNSNLRRSQKVKVKYYIYAFVFGTKIKTIKI